MKVNGNHYRTVWLHPEDDTVVQIIDQTRLPFEFNILNMNTIDQAAFAISEMQVRGAGCIGATAGYGMYLAALHAPKNNRDGFLSAVQQAGEMIKNTRPTAINLAWAANRVFSAISGGEDIEDMISLAKQAAEAIADEDASFCRSIGQHGLPLILDISKRKEGQPVNSSPIAMPAGWHSWTMEARRHPYTLPMMLVSRCMSGWMRPARVTRGPV